MERKLTPWRKKEKQRLHGGKKKERKKEGSGLTMLAGLATDAYSQASSHYRQARSLLPAAFPPWAGTALIMQPGQPRLRRAVHVDARLSAGARSA